MFEEICLHISPFLYFAKHLPFSSCVGLTFSSFHSLTFVILICSASRFRFGGRQIHASEDDGSVNHALVRDLEEDAARLEQFGAELEAE